MSNFSENWSWKKVLILSHTILSAAMATANSLYSKDTIHSALLMSYRVYWWAVLQLILSQRFQQAVFLVTISLSMMENPLPNKLCFLSPSPSNMAVRYNLPQHILNIYQQNVQAINFIKCLYQADKTLGRRDYYIIIKDSVPTNLPTWASLCCNFNSVCVQYGAALQHPAPWEPAVENTPGKGMLLT